MFFTSLSRSIFQNNNTAYFSDTLTRARRLEDPNTTSSLQYAVLPDEKSGRYKISRIQWDSCNGQTATPEIAALKSDLGFKKAVREAERLFNNERSSWESKSPNMRVEYQKEPLVEGFQWTPLGDVHQRLFSPDTALQNSSFKPQPV